MCVFEYFILYADAMTIFIEDARWFKLFNKRRHCRSPDGNEFRNKYPYFYESTTENKFFAITENLT
jgi:hypothetical protein